MSSSEKSPSIEVNARQTEPTDAQAILKLATTETLKVYGRVNVINAIEKAVLAVTICTSDDRIVGHGSFFDYPNINEVDQRYWEKWYNNNFDNAKIKLDNLNALFVHYFVTESKYSNECSKEIIKTVFKAAPKVQYIIIAVPYGAFPEYSWSNMFQPIKSIDPTINITCTLFVCCRHNQVPELYIRQALVEDHDDLAPMFNKHTDILKKTYGSYFLAEIIAAQDDHLQCLVGEVDGRAIAFMSLSDDINYDMLNECFEVGPFHGFRHPDEGDILERPQTKWDPISYPEDPLPMIQSRSSDVLILDMSTENLTNGGIEMKDASNRPMSLASSTYHVYNESQDDFSVSEVLQINPANDQEYTNEKPENLNVSENDKEDDIVNDYTDNDAKVAYSLTRIAMPRLSKHYQSHPPPRFVPKYTGRGKAFAIQLFCINEKYETRSNDFLSKAFSLFPDLEYCIITIPHLIPVFHLLQSFVRVSPRCPSTLPQELYVFHKSGLLKDITVRLACTSDAEGIYELIKNLQLSKHILNDLELYNTMRRDADGNEIQAFVANSCDRIIGVSVVLHEYDIEYVRSHYNIEDFIYFNHHNRSEHGHLLHFALEPAYYNYTKHFLREIMRIGSKTCLYYPVYPKYLKNEKKERHSLITCLSEMVPVHRRHQIDYPLDTLEINAPSRRILEKQEPYVLNHINRKLTMNNKVCINARIVVVGASDVGIAFLQTLAYCPHLRFNNLTLISPHGLPGEIKVTDVESSMLSRNCAYSHDDYAKIGLSIWVNVVYGKMTAIDRAKQAVVVNHYTTVHYDHLILCTGRQYQIPSPINIVKLGPVSESDIYPRTEIYSGKIPQNCFVVNDEFDTSVVLYWIRKNVLPRGENIVLYGNTLDTYTTIYALLKSGISGSKIILVLPPLFGYSSCFNNSTVEKYVNKSLDDEGVKIHKDYVFSYWTDKDTKGLRATVIHFISAKAFSLHIDCGAFLSYSVYDVDYEAFRAVNDACLVYDGKLVIDANFHTNDIAIRAAGPMTKFKRRYHVGEWGHHVFNSKEIGISLATEFLKFFDPTMEPIEEQQTEILNLIPIYRNAKFYACMLPGDYQYLHFQKPSLPAMAESQKIEYVCGTEYETGTPNESGYFRLYINQYSTVESVTCFSKKAFSESNISQLYGISERFLNNLSVRYRDSLISDFYEFFKEHWALILYHDRFEDFCSEVREMMVMKDASGKSIEDLVRTTISEDAPVNVQQLEFLMSEFNKTDTKTAVEIRLLNFISYNYYHLPMFAKPGMV